MKAQIKIYKCTNYYLIDENGVVYNTKTNRIINQTLSKNGYYQVRLYKTDDNTKHNNRASYLVHRLVAATFIPFDNDLLYTGGYNNNLTVDHIDGNKLNNNVSNLRWISFLDNVNGAKQLGHNNPDKKYEDVSEELVNVIIQDLINLYSVKEICAMRNVSKGMVRRIRQKVRWKNLTKDIVFPTTYAHKSRDEELTIVYYSLYSKLDSIKLSKLLKEKINIKVSHSNIQYIRNKETLLDYITYVENGNFKPSTTIETLLE